MQNKGHIASLNKYYEGQFSGKFYSYIVFSERCTIKEINVWSKITYVLERNELFSTIKSQFTTDEVDMIYNAFEKYTMVEKEINKKSTCNLIHH